MYIRILTTPKMENGRLLKNDNTTSVLFYNFIKLWGNLIILYSGQDAPIVSKLLNYIPYHMLDSVTFKKIDNLNLSNIWIEETWIIERSERD